jgi:hypothetical protein
VPCEGVDRFKTALGRRPLERRRVDEKGMLTTDRDGCFFLCEEFSYQIKMSRLVGKLVIINFSFYFLLLVQLHPV